MKTIIVTGVPCTGKTTLAKNIAKLLKFKYIDVNKIIAKYNLTSGYDTKRKSKIVDTKKLSNILIKLIKSSKKRLIIDSHLSHYLPRNYVGLCIVTVCELKTLRKRLKNRGYNVNKVRENLDAEIFDICLQEAIENKHNIIVIDTSKKIPINKIKKICQA